MKYESFAKMGVIRALVWLKHAIEYCFLPFRHQKGFYFKGEYYPYFYGMYQATWRNERKMEIPIFKKLIEGKEDKILEIGNVLNHHARITHPVVDLYEKAEGVINQDICTFKTHKKYDLIISISTIEHVHDPERAIKNIMSLLNDNGSFMFSVPSGVNKKLDALLPKLKVSERHITPIKLRVFSLTREQSQRNYDLNIIKINKNKTKKDKQIWQKY